MNDWIPRLNGVASVSYYSCAKSTWNNEDVGVWESFVGAHSVSILCVGGEGRSGTPEVLSSLYPSFSTSWDLGVAPAASALASRNWHWVHCLQREAHGCGLKVHSWDQNAVWNTNSLCALAALFPWLPHPHQASRTKLPPLAHVSTCGLSFYSHPHTHTHTHTHVSFWWWGPGRYLKATI